HILEGPFHLILFHLLHLNMFLLMHFLSLKLLNHLLYGTRPYLLLFWASCSR
ncbi:unnamed protein product, partial [Prunus brigantina]